MSSAKAGGQGSRDISFGTGDAIGENELLRYEENDNADDPFSITSISVATGEAGRGEWEFVPYELDEGEEGISCLKTDITEGVLALSNTFHFFFICILK